MFSERLFPTLQGNIGPCRIGLIARPSVAHTDVCLFLRLACPIWLLTLIVDLPLGGCRLGSYRVASGSSGKKLVPMAARILTWRPCSRHVSTQMTPRLQTTPTFSASTKWIITLCCNPVISR